MKIERIDNVIKVRFDQECRLTAPRIFQYDRGQRIEFLDIPDGVEVQFSNDDTDKTSNKIITDSQVEIPDFLIAMNGTITAYLQYIDENSQTTKKFLVIPVQERKQPEEYISEDDEPGFRADMQKIMNDTKEIAESAKKEAEKIKLTITDETINKLAKYVHNVLGLRELNCNYDINQEKCRCCVKRTSKTRKE